MMTFVEYMLFIELQVQFFLILQMDSNSVPIHQFHYDSTDYHLDLSTNQKEDQLSKVNIFP